MVAARRGFGGCSCPNLQIIGPASYHSSSVKSCMRKWRRAGWLKSGWIGEEGPVAGVPLAPEVPRSLVMDKGGRTARPRPRLRHTPLRPRRPRRHPQEVEARRQGKKGGKRKTGLVTRGSRCGGAWAIPIAAGGAAVACARWRSGIGHAPEESCRSPPVA